MTTFAQQMALDDAVFFNTDEFGDICTYTPFATLVPVSDVPVSIEIGTGLARNGDGAADSDIARIPSSAGIPVPARNDYFVIGSTRYTVLQRISGDGEMWTLAVEADQRQNPKGG